jgi:hypothetical protein
LAACFRKGEGAMLNGMFIGVSRLEGDAHLITGHYRMVCQTADRNIRKFGALIREADRPVRKSQADESLAFDP